MNQFGKISLNILLRIFRAQKILAKKVNPALPLTSLTERDTAVILPKIDSLSSWQKEWVRSARKSMIQAKKSADNDKAKALYKKASSMYHLAQLFANYDSKIYNRLEQKKLKAYQSFACLDSPNFEFINISSEHHRDIHGYFQHPHIESPAPAVLILTHLGGVKEDLDFMANFFLQAGFATLRLDLPGFGESPGALPMDSEKICSKAIDLLMAKSNIQKSGIVSIGISLGSYWTMKTAAVDPRIKLAVGISTPVIMGKQWNKLPKRYWQYFKKCFAARDLVEARVIAKQLSLEQTMDKINCPILLFHGQKDKISRADAMELLLNDIQTTVYPYVYADSSHGCVNKLYHDILPVAVARAKEILNC